MVLAIPPMPAALETNTKASEPATKKARVERPLGSGPMSKFLTNSCIQQEKNVEFILNTTPTLTRIGIREATTQALHYEKLMKTAEEAEDFEAAGKSQIQNLRYILTLHFSCMAVCLFRCAQLIIVISSKYTFRRQNSRSQCFVNAVGQYHTHKNLLMLLLKCRNTKSALH